MIEVHLDRVMTCVLYHLKVLAAVRCMCVDHELPVDWCLEWERDVAETVKELRELIETKGTVLQIR